MNSIFKRQSIRKYLDKPVEQEKIELMLKAGMQAPSAANQQPWEFLVVTDKEKLQALSGLSPYSKPVANCGVAFVLLCNLDNVPLPQYWQQDMATAAENMLLQATELELGGVWLAVPPEENRKNYITTLFKLPDNIKPFCVLSIGYPDEARTMVERYDASRVHYEQY